MNYLSRGIRMSAQISFVCSTITVAGGWSADAEMLYSSTAFSCRSGPAAMKPTLTSDRLSRHPVHCSTASVMIADSETIRHCWWTAPCSAVHVCVWILGPRWSTTCSPAHTLDYSRCPICNIFVVYSMAVYVLPSVKTAKKYTRLLWMIPAES